MDEQKTLELFLAGGRLFEVYSQLSLSLRSHSTHVAVICTVMAKHAQPQLLAAYPGLRGCQLHDALFIGGRYHDIGRMYLPKTLDWSSINDLNEIEAKILQRHPENALEILDTCIGEELRGAAYHVIADMCYCHHERCDGSGYPRRLFGSAIPVAGRLCGIANQFDLAVQKKRSANSRTRLDSVFRTMENTAEAQFGTETLGWLMSAEAEIRNIYDVCIGKSIEPFPLQTATFCTKGSEGASTSSTKQVRE